MIHVGWGWNRWYGATDVLARALDALVAGRVTLLALDVTDADAHSLEGPLVQSARQTGGFYQRTHLFPELAVARVAQMLAGHYELSFAQPELPAGRHAIAVTLRGHRGTAYHKRFYDDGRRGSASGSGSEAGSSSQRTR